MLTARRAFQGEDVSETLAAVLKSVPDWSALPSPPPALLRSLVEGSLKKDRRERIADISTSLSSLLNHPHALQTVAPVSHPSPWPVWGHARLVVVALLIGVGAAIGGWKLKPPPVPVTRFVMPLPPGQRLTLAQRAVAISPDGARIVYAAEGQLFLRSMSELEPSAIVGAGLLANPVFAPDGQSLVFWADSTLKRIAVNGGVPVPICQTSGFIS